MTRFTFDANALYLFPGFTCVIFIRQRRVWENCDTGRANLLLDECEGRLNVGGCLSEVRYNLQTNCQTLFLGMGLYRCISSAHAWHLYHASSGGATSDVIPFQGLMSAWGTGVDIGYLSLKKRTLMWALSCAYSHIKLINFDNPVDWNGGVVQYYILYRSSPRTWSQLHFLSGEKSFMKNVLSLIFPVLKVKKLFPYTRHPSFTCTEQQIF